MFAEYVEHHMSVMSEITKFMIEIMIDDTQIVDPGVPLSGNQENLRQVIWMSLYLLIGKENALHSAALGAVFDIDV